MDKKQAAEERAVRKQEATDKIRNLIIDTRKKLDISKYEFGQMLGTKSHHVLLWEEGRSLPTSPMLLMIMELARKADEQEETFEEEKQTQGFH